MISARTRDVHRAVAIIDPDKHRHAECVTAVSLALVEIPKTDADIRRLFHSQTKPGKQAAGRLGTALKKLQKALNDTNTPENLRNLFPDEKHPDPAVPWRQDPIRQERETSLWLALWLKRIEAAQKKTGRRKFHFKAMRKMVAAYAAHNLLQQFNRDIVTTKGSAFCKLAALLYGTPRANFTRQCWVVLKDKNAKVFLG